ncbi:hypothetical protein NN561_020286 [Cricetulus griseus]
MQNCHWASTCRKLLSTCILGQQIEAEMQLGFGVSEPTQNWGQERQMYAELPLGLLVSDPGTKLGSWAGRLKEKCNDALVCQSPPHNSDAGMADGCRTATVPQYVVYRL